jgi:hypothetical protein
MVTCPALREGSSLGSNGIQPYLDVVDLLGR